MAESATIQVSRQARDHLAQVAKERRLASEQSTGEQIAERVAATRTVLRERLGCTLSDDEFDSGPNVLANIYAMAADQTRALRENAA
ncbi:hypothetical protein ACFWR9_31995 [Streptomyces sp. NPDC058534]|uniref:hypothetical protein n=1 Tax=Streptomyces sp. NPDC058534 TaxID=3346541 RepID=UPI003647ED14